MNGDTKIADVGGTSRDGEMEKETSEKDGEN